LSTVVFEVIVVFVVELELFPVKVWFDEIDNKSIHFPYYVSV